MARVEPDSSPSAKLLILNLEVIDVNGDAAFLHVQRIVSIDDKPYTAAPPPVDAGLEHRITVLEQNVLSIIGALSLPLQPQPVSSSVVSQPPSDQLHSSSDESPDLLVSVLSDKPLTTSTMTLPVDGVND